jgi:MFS family permease
MTRPSIEAPPHYRRNFAAFTVDYVFFSIALAFASPSSMLPAFVRQFTDSAPVIGLVSTIFNGCWLLPQVIIAQVVGRRMHKKPFLLIGATGRIAFWIIAMGLWLGLGQHPSRMLILFFVCLGAFAVTDTLASVAWFDMMARAIPLKRRGQLMGIAQVISGLGGLGVGVAITVILSSPRFPFPNNYALIFTLASLALVPTVIAAALLREVPAGDAGSNGKRWGHNGWLSPLRQDPAFRRLMVSQVLVGMISLATPFYVVHATDALNLSQAIVGSFVGAQQVAGVASGVLLGLLSARRGPSPTIRVGSAVAIIGPLFALVAHIAGDSVLSHAYPLVYVTLGVYSSSNMLGFYNYMMEIAPEDMRPTYIGLGNTIMGVLTLAPTVGGWVLESTSYTVLFAITAVSVFAGFLLALRLGPAEQNTFGANRP